MKHKISISIFLLALLLAPPWQIAVANHPIGVFQQARSAAEKFLRTELYFGRAKPDGSTVTDEEWDKFLAEVVTPRFPDGFTVVDGLGQFRDKNGKISREQSKVLILLYPRKQRRNSRAKIEEIRSAYVKLFNQESVLRMDLPRSVEVLF